MNEPLAIKLRPKNLDEVIGQKHLIDQNKVIRNLVNNKKLFSMILFGRPGIGKTSLANAIVNELEIRHRFLNAVINNKKDFDIVVEEAKMYNGLIVIMDEIHRLNKDKQDLLLPYIENGLITLIGLTSSNPFHKINPSIRSRCQIFELNNLTENDIKLGIKKAISSEYLKDIQIDEESINYLIKLSNGDLRFAYNTLEMAYYSSNNKKIDLTLLKNINNKPIFLSDKNEENHYDLLSAFQKSIRGSDVDAAIYYLANLIEADDFDSIYRRMTVIAYEDIGLANPNIILKVEAAINAAERVGMPEAKIVLSNIIIEMALSPKSNSSYLAIEMALNDIRSGKNYPVPKHIKTHSNKYLYPHDYPYSFVKQQYLPDKLKTTRYYYPKNNKNEINLKQIYENLKSS